MNLALNESQHLPLKLVSYGLMYSDPINLKKLENLHDLVKDMKKEQQHEETFADAPVGKEII